MGILPKNSRKKRINKWNGGRISRRQKEQLHCQCDPNCKRPVKHGDTFCAYHTTKGCPVKAHLSGAEPAYDPNVYNSDNAVKWSHNCHAYALGVYDKNKIEKCRNDNKCEFPVAGRIAGHERYRGKMGKTCSDVLGRTWSEVPTGYMTNFETRCKPNFSKIAVVVDEDQDYHYYRQDNNGWWSHKPGARNVTNKDATGAHIWNPKLASRYYPRENDEDTDLNYDSFCSFMCIPRDKPIELAGGKRKEKRKRKTRKQLY